MMDWIAFDFFLVISAISLEMKDLFSVFNKILMRYLSEIVFALSVMEYLLLDYSSQMCKTLCWVSVFPCSGQLSVSNWFLSQYIKNQKTSPETITTSPLPQLLRFSSVFVVKNMCLAFHIIIQIIPYPRSTAPQSLVIRILNVLLCCADEMFTPILNIYHISPAMKQSC